MAGCCDARGCDQVFGPRFAHHLAKRYRRRGLDRTSRRIVDWLVAQGIEGASVLEIGGAIGELQLELLDSRFAANNGEATLPQLQAYASVTNTLQRTLRAIGLQRRQRDVTPTLQEYLASKEAAE